MNKRLFPILIFIVIFAINIVAHGIEDEGSNLSLISERSLQYIYVAGLIMILITIFSILFEKKLPARGKSVTFWLITIPVIFATIYLVGSTIYLNIKSPTHGPVHWHADFEIEICSKDIELVDPKGLFNRVGTPLLHEHNDNRIHVEGTPYSLQSIDLAAFFQAIGGEFSSSRLVVPTNEGRIIIENGQLCNGKPGRLMLFVEKQQGKDRVWKMEESMGEYIMAGYSTIPPGDRIKIIFTSESQEDVLNQIIMV